MFAHQHSLHDIDQSLEPNDCHFEQSMLAPSTLYAKFKIILFNGMPNPKVYSKVIALKASR